MPNIQDDAEADKLFQPDDFDDEDAGAAAEGHNMPEIPSDLGKDAHADIPVPGEDDHAQLADRDAARPPSAVPEGQLQTQRPRGRPAPFVPSQREYDEHLLTYRTEIGARFALRLLSRTNHIEDMPTLTETYRFLFLTTAT